MTYADALKVKKNDTVCLKYANYTEMQVSGIKIDRQRHVVVFQCADRDYNHKEVALPLSNEELAQKFLHNPKTRVYIHRNRELGEWLYSVVVADADEFWLASFDTEKEAEGYITEHHLKKISNEE